METDKYVAEFGYTKTEFGLVRIKFGFGQAIYFIVY